MIEQAQIERMAGNNVHPSAMVDSLRDLCAEALSETGQTVTTASLTAAVLVVEYMIKKAPEHPATQNIADTVDHAVLAVVLNRTTESMTTAAKRFNITKQAFSKRCLDVKDRLGLPMRAGKSERARESYRTRAYKVHERRRRSVPKFNWGAIKKGFK